MLKTVLPVIIICSGPTILAQVNLKAEFQSIRKCQEYEFALNSMEVDSADLTFDLNITRQKLYTSGWIYKREISDFVLDFHVWYLFGEDKNETAIIRYYWGLYNPNFNADDNIELLYSLSEKEEIFTEKFHHLYNQITSTFGEPLETKEEIDQSHFLSKSEIWELEDRFIILTLNFSREIRHFPGVGYQTNNFEVDLMLFNKKAL